MTIGVSDHYRLLSTDEVDALSIELAQGWKDESIPRRQWISTVRAELQRYREGEPMPHFDVLVRALRRTGIFNPSLLDVGASAGYYSEVLRLAGFQCRYTALDYSEAFQAFAREIYPGIIFDVGDARALPYLDGTFQIVVDAGCMLHIREYAQVIHETARVAKQWAVFHRVPVLFEGPTEFYIKEAYGVQTIEARFSEPELLDLFAAVGLELVSAEDVFVDTEAGYGHRTYLLRK